MGEDIRERIKKVRDALNRLKDAQKEIEEKYQTRNCAWCGDTIKPGSPFIAYDRDEIYCDWECMARDHGGFEVEFLLSDVDDERKYYLSYFWPKPEEDEQKGKEDNNEIQD
jgi:hypothetical protein